MRTAVGLRPIGLATQHLASMTETSKTAVHGTVDAVVLEARGEAIVVILRRTTALTQDLRAL
jgi:hypothetical protein